MLCEHCTRYIRHFEDAKPWQAGSMIHHSSSRSLKRASKQGCSMCRILYGARMERLSSFIRSEAIWTRASGPNFALVLDIYTSKTPGGTIERQRIVSQLNRIFPRRGKVQLAISCSYNSLTSCETACESMVIGLPGSPALKLASRWLSIGLTNVARIILRASDSGHVKNMSGNQHV